MAERHKASKPMLFMSGALLLLVIAFSLIIIQLRGSEQIIENMDLDRAFALMETKGNGDSFVLLDIRTPGEFEADHIRGATNLDFYSESFRDDLDELKKDRTYLVYCQRGERTQETLALFRELGFRRVYILFEGFKEWTAYGFPTANRPDS